MTSRPTTAAPILAVLAIVLVTLGAYVGGYFWLSKRQVYLVLTEGIPPQVRREFPTKPLAMVYQPLARIESWVSGSGVSAVGANPYGE
jgi:hypothetical protein